MKFKSILMSLAILAMLALNACKSSKTEQVSLDQQTDVSTPTVIQKDQEGKEKSSEKRKIQNTSTYPAPPRTEVPPPPPPPPVIEEIAESELSFMEDIEPSMKRAYAPAQQQSIQHETYARIVENEFKNSTDEPLSTFSLDVDRASYSNVRRMLLDGHIPPADAVRIEEMINYFDYKYEQPKGQDPIAMHTSLTECPWNEQHQVLHVAVKATEIETDELPASNLVFLLDVSGSMNQPNKLPLVKKAFRLLVNELRPEDKVAIVTYAGNAGVALESTPVSNKAKILSAMESLRPGGSTAGAQGIISAYKIAKENFIEDGNNRVILATDGDFNVGVSSPEALEDLIEQKRNSGIFLSVLGFGTGNYRDHQMQTLANKGNGNHAYIDNMLEAQKILVNEFGGTMFTIAKDVKIQIEFNPAYVSSYRLIGYENRLLNKEDFNDDTKDAGEVGSGHTVTALYEIIPQGVESSFTASVDPLKYQPVKISAEKFDKNGEFATLKFRYKKPDENQSKKITQVVSPKVVKLNQIEDATSMALAVAEFGMLLRNSNYSQQSSVDQILSLAANVNGISDKDEFIKLVKLYEGLSDTEE